ncbi:MAG TPA: copper homeostasis membrane protein CopD [Stellaceae bacterium]|nr:copper homeostasis membrane protein CopD [Stellaceae bacterium]
MTSIFGDAVRGAHYISIVSLFGCFAFLFLVARPAFRDAGAAAGERERFDRFLSVLAEASIAAALVTGFLWLWVTTAGMAGTPLGAAFSPKLFATVLGQTDFGRLWTIRFAAALLLAVFIALRRITRKPSSWLVFAIVGGVLAGLVLGSMGFAGHGNDDTGSAHLKHLTADILHLLAAGGWLGALAPLVFVLRRARTRAAGNWLAIAQQATVRFSTLGIATVGTLVATGLVNSWYLLGGLPGLFGTTYGLLLILKVALFLAMLSLAAVNRLRLTPRLAGASEGEADGSHACHHLCCSAACETLVAAALLLVLGALVHLKPGMHDEPTWPFPYTFDPMGNMDFMWTRGAYIACYGAAAVGVIAAAAAAAMLALRRWRTAGVAVLAGFAAFYVAARPFIVGAYPTTYKYSPVKYGSLPIAQGEPLFAQNCVTCHGPYGYGDGPLAASLQIKPANLTEEHLFHHGEGTLYWWIGHGIAGTPMPAFRSVLRPTQRWDLLAYLRAQAEAEQSNTMGPAAGGYHDVVAPNFAFQFRHGAQQTLADERDKHIVLLVLFSDPGSLSRLHALDDAAPQLEKRGVRIIAVPMAKNPEGESAKQIGLRHLRIAEAGPDVVAAYSLFRRKPSLEGVPPVPPHMEFLIDRSGYLRFRWIPAWGPGWDQMAALSSQVHVLNAEPPRPPAPMGGMQM